MSKVYFVDLPRIDDTMENVGEFDTMQEALEFIREHVGDCDDQGRICLISEMEEDE